MTPRKYDPVFGGFYSPAKSPTTFFSTGTRRHRACPPSPNAAYSDKCRPRRSAMEVNAYGIQFIRGHSRNDRRLVVAAANCGDVKTLASAIDPYAFDTFGACQTSARQLAPFVHKLQSEIRHSNPRVDPA